MSPEKLTVAVDIDEVLADHAEAFIEFSNKLYGTNNTIDDYTEYWAELFKISNEEVHNLGLEAYKDGAMRRFNHKKDSEQVLRKLSQKYNLVVVTARKTIRRDDTLAWLEERYSGIFSDVHFAGFWDEVTDDSVHATKKELVQTIGADFLIDDQPKHCEAVAEAGIQAILFGDYAWNRGYKSHKNLVKLHDWASVGDYLWRQ